MPSQAGALAVVVGSIVLVGWAKLEEERAAKRAASLAIRHERMADRAVAA